MSLETGNSSVMEVREEEQATPRRGWRFFGTFGCLALLNLICAVDATILAVALPVRHTHHPYYIYYTNTSQDHRYRPRSDSYTSFLVRNLLPLMLHRLPADVGIFFTYHRPEVGPACCTVSLHRWYHRRLGRYQHHIFIGWEVSSRLRGRWLSWAHLRDLGGLGHSPRER